MPFGAVFASLFFAAVGVLFAVPRVPMLPPGLGLAEAALALGFFGLALGLAMRRSWARWFGAIASAGLVALRAPLALQGSTVADLVILFGALASCVLLLVPVTGRFRREPRADSVPPGVALEAEAIAAASTADAAAPEGARVADSFEPARSSRPSRASRWLGGAVATVTVVALAVAAAAIVPSLDRLIPSVGTRSLGDMGIHVVDWETFGSGLARARSEGKPVLVDFYAEWCGPCKMMDRTTFRDPTVIEKLEGVIPVRIDAEGLEAVDGFVGAELAERYTVETYPTLILMDADGREHTRLRGARGPQGFVSWLDDALGLVSDGNEPSGPDLDTFSM